MNNVPSALYMSVDEHRLLGEVGRLFGSISDALAEVVQNAHRARATRLDVSVTGRTITLVDDGPGLSDPATLFTVARSGWAEEIATDPAGIGAFALFALAERVEVTSVPSAGASWTAAFGPEAFAGAPIAIEELPDAPPFRTGLKIRVQLKPEVRLPDLLKSRWRHCFPVEVTVSMDGATPVEVPPVTGWPDARVVPTPVGPVEIAERVDGRTSRAVWEHRIVALPADALHRIKEHLPEGAAGAVVKALLQDRVIEWAIDTSSTGTRPKLPDRTHLIDDAALDDALREIATALADQVDAEKLLQLAAAAAGDDDILADDSIGSIHARSALGALGTFVPLRVMLPFLGYGQTWRATRPESWRVYLAVSSNEDSDEWTALAEAVWVRPSYRVESDPAEAIALAEGIPAVLPSPLFPGAEHLPLVRLDAAALTASTAIGQIFATDLHLVSEGVRLAPVTHVYTREMCGEGADEALPPNWAAALKGLTPGPAGGGRVYPWSFWLGLHPLPEGMRPIDYVLRSSAFAFQATRESAADEWPVWFWDYADAHRNRVDREQLVRDLADRFAQEIGPATAAEVKRESRAWSLSARFAALEPRIRHALARIELETGDGEGLNAGVLKEISGAGTRLCTLLAAATPAHLLSS
jgi:hypothetical protein